ncbi:hypothetical protein [Mycobacteroides abscessus]|uniref:hypothetical protein n=2 Tax=Mycobacteroides abscessus TaxID=36809 RepID=UPI000301C5A9|nr:hypothetical protein [Mycobacteroides abscessus]SIJ95668.1 Uncharacterised protein [Mycobacteroides abscessus subsp. abscessus]SKK24636.1 Uncharacterised protein [Mycobacteroides abscessus subsp. massiliense]SKK30629.1 Uncharacterised protein [Mycobacteroides abscessus subsp. massiliense]SKK50406.1 Uncharacterised protein [Mycobacteroides abscessus subsp. massiliense]SLC96370.1 Uncharacterised protein [Mycobacteroides abscessus subsp. massiliense]
MLSASTAAPYDARMSQTPEPRTDWLTLTDVAAEMGWSVKTARNRHHDANTNRANNTEKPGDLPEPDHHIGNKPVWKPATIATFKANRPGRGAGGGRPWHK